MKILYIITGLSMGGAETITVNLAHHIYQRGHSVQIICLGGEQIIKVPETIKVYNLNMRKDFFGTIFALKKAAKIIKNYNPDVVHANMFHAIIFSRILRILIHFPKLICTEHSNNYHGKIRLIMEHFTDGMSDLNTNVSKMATDYFIKKGLFSKEKSITMYNGIDLSRFYKRRNIELRNSLNIKENDFVFINISRFNVAKDHKSLINAFYNVNQQNPNTKLICVGDGELFSEIKLQVEKLNISDSVIFTGVKNNTEDYYNIADCFVLSSIYEGFGLVLVEAMACELEVIATDCGGTKEIINNNNKLVPIQSPDLLSERMLEVLNSPKIEREKNGKDNRSAVEKFDINKITEEWEMYYKK